MKIAIYIYNRPNMYSGGQYHAYILGKAIAAQDHQVDFIWNHKPVFVSEFSNIITENYSLSDYPGLNPLEYDYVIVAPSGLYVPDFYEKALESASCAGARICLLNYESENWFNKLAPTQDDYRVWDYWRRVLCFGGLVISSVKEADPLARQFYHAPDFPINFEVLQAPINSISASCVRDLHPEKDGSVVVFVRRQHDYKGAHDLLKISPEVFGSRTIHIVFGGDIDFCFVRALNKYYKGYDAKIVYHNRISVDEKFMLLAKAQLLLFPSYFEGFGYPPVEAFAVGTEVVCYDLPVLRENLGNVPFYAPVGDILQLEICLKKAFNSNRDTRLFTEIAEKLSGFHRCGEEAVKILARNVSISRPLANYRAIIKWGPFNPEQGLALPVSNYNPPYPVFVSYSYNNLREHIIDIKAIFRTDVIAIQVDKALLRFLSQRESISKSFPGWKDFIFRFKVIGCGEGTLTFFFNDKSIHREIFQTITNIKPSLQPHDTKS